MKRTPVALTAVLTTAVALAGCSTSATDQHATATLEHVHGLGHQPGGDLFVAAHSGVWTLPAAKVTEALDSKKDLAGTQPVQVAGRGQDTMGLEMTPDGTLLASGHPDPNEQPDLDPPVLGLILSSDGAETWETVSLRGEADLHDIEAVPLPDGNLRVYGYDSTRSTVISSLDSGRNWTSGAQLAIRDLAAVPGESNAVYATTEQGLALSEDAGASFAAMPDAPALFLVDTSSSVGAVGIDVEGTLWRQDGDSWKSGGTVTGAPQAMLAVDGDDGPWVLVADDRGVMATADLGQSWITLITS